MEVWPVLGHHQKIVKLLVYLCFFLFLFTLSTLVLQADLALQSLPTCGGCVRGSIWVTFPSWGRVLKLWFSPSLGQCTDCTLWLSHLQVYAFSYRAACGSFQIESSLPQPPKDHFKNSIRSHKLAARSQSHSADGFLVQGLLWVVLFCFYLC